jgi:hypothetical protein
MPPVKKGKSRSPEKGSQVTPTKSSKYPAPVATRQKEAVATYFLAKHSGLFRRGQPLILANTLPAKKLKGRQK